MKHLKLLLSSALLVILVGCATTLVGKWQQSVRGSDKTVDAFLRLERDNEITLRNIDPEIGIYANKLRREYPSASRLAWDLIEVYRQSPSTNTYGQAVAAMGVLDKILAEVQTRMTATQNAMQKGGTQ